ncbi:hypothetical protein [Shewanella waksmanii]|uniref:hypothetical protein n=1 Tax=Shewanella waksmanii TaxID=213783 RepID=UPI003736296D
MAVIVFKWICIAIWLSFFSYQFFRLRHWRLCFWLDEAAQLNWYNSEDKRPVKLLVVGSYLCAFYVEGRLIIVWRDMCDEAQYRSLCRVLLKSRN